MKIFNPFLLVFVAGLSFSTIAQESIYNVKLLNPKPALYLPVIHEPFEQREAKISAIEYPIAQQIRPLITAQKYREVMTILTEYSQSTDMISPALNLLMAQIQLQLKDTSEAEKYYLAALQKMPSLVRAHEGLSVLYILLEQFNKAQKSLIKAISLGLNDSQAYAQLAYLNMQLNKPFSAINAYQQALMLDPDNENISNGLLFALTRTKQFNAAISLLDQKLINNSSNPDLWIQRANLALEMKDNEKAISSIEVAIRLGNNTTETYQLAAQIHLTQKNYLRAVHLLEKLINNHKLSMVSFNNLLTWLLKEEQWDNAEKLLTSMNNQINNTDIYSTSSDKSRLLHHQGVIAESKNSIKKAKSYFKQAIKLDPSNGESLISLAKLSFTTNNFAYAELLYQRAENIDIVKLPAMLGRAQIYIDQKDFLQALTLLQKARKEFPHRHDLDSNIQTLSNIVNSQI